MFSCTTAMVTSWACRWRRSSLDGKSVTLVSPLAEIAPFTAFTHERQGICKNLKQLGVSLVSGHLVDQVTVGGASGHATFDRDSPNEWAADSVVLVTQRLSNDALHSALDLDRSGLEDAGIKGLYRIGDCVSPRLIADSVFDGHRLAREIDTDDPATPLPFIREHRVLGSRDADFDAILNPARPELQSNQPPLP